MSFFHLSIFLSAVIGLIIIAGIRSFDIYEKETFVSMLWAFFAGGTTSVLIALGIYEFLHIFGIDDTAISNTLGSFLVIGPVEEFAKLVGLIIVYGLIKKRFNELTDGIIYMSCVALGFSIIENFFYANAGENNQYLLVFRAFISTPAHISFSVLLGYAWYRYRHENKPFITVIIALLIASALHGLFDALAFSPWLNFILLIYLYLVITLSLRIVQYSNILSPFRPGFSALFETPENSLTTDLECPFCRSDAPKPLFRNRWFSACRCESCGNHISSVHDIAEIFRIFAPEYKRFRKKVMPVKLSDGRIVNSVYGSAFLGKDGRLGFYRVDEIAGRLQVINDTLLTQFRKRSFISGSLLRRFFE
jgi:RsiW-degrading membrane proteinase PrsW (M82 family)